MHIALAVPHLYRCEPAAVDITLIYGWCERISLLRIGLSSFRLGSSVLRIGLSVLRIGLSVLLTHRIHMGDTQLSDRDLMHFMHECVRCKEHQVIHTK